MGEQETTMEKFYASAHQNLMKLHPPVPPKPQRVSENTSDLQGYFGLTNEKIRDFLNGNGNIGNGNHQHQSRADVEAWINELLDK